MTGIFERVHDEKEERMQNLQDWVDRLNKILILHISKGVEELKFENKQNLKVIYWRAKSSTIFQYRHLKKKYSAS